jgi:hypothetical protein
MDTQIPNYSCSSYAKFNFVLVGFSSFDFSNYYQNSKVEQSSAPRILAVKGSGERQLEDKERAGILTL